MDETALCMEDFHAACFRFCCLSQQYSWHNPPNEVIPLFGLPFPKGRGLQEILSKLPPAADIRFSSYKPVLPIKR